MAEHVWASSKASTCLNPKQLYCPLPIYQHGRACSRRITTSCNENKIGVHLAPIKLCGEENKSTPSKPTAFSSWFCWVIKAATLTSGKDDGHSGFGAPCHRCVVFVDSRDEKVQRLREKIYDIFIIIRIYHIHLNPPPRKKKKQWHWNMKRKHNRAGLESLATTVSSSNLKCHTVIALNSRKAKVQQKKCHQNMEITILWLDLNMPLGLPAICH